MSDVIGAPSAEPTATPTATPTAAATPAESFTPTTQGAAFQPTTQAAGTTPQGGTEDRSSWVPPYRIRETREAAIREAQTEWAQREAQYQARMQQIQNQLHALVGVQPPANPEQDAVRQQFNQLYPGLARLEEHAAELLAIRERAGDLESQNDHYWQSYGRQNIDRLFKAAEATLGGPLTDEAKRALHSAFTGFVSNSPELTARYTNDPSLVDEYWRTFSSNFIDPVRRGASAMVAGRAAQVPGLPQDTPGGAPRTGPAPQPKSLDERTAMGWAQYNQTAKP